MLDQFRKHLKRKALVHLESEEAIKAQKQEHFEQALKRMNQHQYNWAFGNTSVETLNDLNHAPAHDGKTLAECQRNYPPYGPFVPGEVLVQNSGSTSKRRPYPFTIETWLHYVTPAARGLLMLGANENDRILTTDTGGTQSGYRTPEDAAVWICGAQLIYDRSVSLGNKVKAMNEFDVNFFVSNFNKLERISKLKSVKLNHKLKGIISTGIPLNKEKMQQIADYFGVEHFMDFYGSTEMGNIYFTCKHGHKHVHDDFVHAIQRDGKTYFSSLVGLPLWNYDLGDRLEYSYKGKCECGSYLPTVDLFEPKNYSGIKKS